MAKRLKGEAWRKRCQEVWDRDDGLCILCGREGTSPPHHVQFKSRGGSDDMDNLATLCLADHEDAHGGAGWQQEIRGKLQEYLGRAK